MKNKGFTLVELLATLTILSILMLIAIPNVMSILDKNKRSTYIEDAKKLVTLAEYKYKSTTTIDKPTSTYCIVMRMSYLDQTELDKGPNNKEYDVEASYVVIRYNAGIYEYYVSLVEKSDPVRGVRLVNSSKLTSDDAMMKYVFEGANLKINSLPTAEIRQLYSFQIYNESSTSANICQEIYIY